MSLLMLCYSLELIRTPCTVKHSHINISVSSTELHPVGNKLGLLIHSTNDLGEKEFTPSVDLIGLIIEG